LKRILLIIKNDIKRRLKSPFSIIILLLIPLLMTGIMGAIFSPSENKMPKINLAIVNNDNYIGSKIFIEAFNSSQTNEMFNIKNTDEITGKKLIKNNKVSALIIIPKGFSEALLKKTNTQLILIKNPSQQFLPNIVEEFTKTLTIIISGAVQTIEMNNELLNLFSSSKLSYNSMITKVPKLLNNKSNNKKTKMMMEYLKAPLFKLVKKTANKKIKKKSINLFTYILPSISIMFLLFIIEIFIRDILTERENGKLQRMMFAPLRTSEYIASRILSGWIMGIMSFFIVVLTGILIFKINWGNYLYLFILIAVTSFWISSFFALLNAFFKNKNQAGAFVAPIIMVFSAFGGSIIQTNQLPEAVRWISYFTLNHWFIIGVAKIRYNTFPITSILILLISGIILYISASIFLKKRIIL